MNKKGYTLAEALITLGIIGIIAALVVPAANKARPNENKLRFLQTYDTIETQIKNFTQNSRYFPTCQDGFPDPNNQGQFITRCFPDYPLFNTSAGVDNILLQDNQHPNRPLPVGYITDFKLCYLLADAMGTTTPMANRCQGNYPNAPDFVTPNGIAFAFDNTMNVQGNGRFLKTIVFDVTGDLTVDHSGGGQPNPSTFTIAITADGSVYPNDTAGIQYLAHRNDNREKFDNNINENFNLYTIQPDNNDERQQIIFSN